MPGNFDILTVVIARPARSSSHSAPVLMLFGLIGAGRLVRGLGHLRGTVRRGSWPPRPRWLRSSPSSSERSTFNPGVLALVVPGAAIAFIGGVLLKK